MRYLFKVRKVQFVIYDNTFFIDQFLEDQTNLHLLVWVLNVTDSTLLPIILCLHQLLFIKEYL